MFILRVVFSSQVDLCNVTRVKCIEDSMRINYYSICPELTVACMQIYGLSRTDI